MSSPEMRANRARPISPDPSGTLESASRTLSARLGSGKSPEGCLAPGGWDRQGNPGLMTVLAQGDWEVVVVVAVGGNCPGSVLMGGSAPASLGTPPVSPTCFMGTLTTSQEGRTSFHQVQIPPLHLGAACSR